MLPYLRRRLLVAGLTLLGIATIVFALVHLLPGDPAETMLARSGASPEAVAALRAELGLDQPLPVQYIQWLASLARGDLGRSLFFGRPVTELIRAELPFTLTLALAALVWAIVLGPSMGTIAAYWRDRWPDRVAMLLAVGGAAVPVFWSGLLLIWLFSVHLAWLPATGADSLQALVMPSLVLGFASAGPIARITRATLSQALAQPYALVASAKGLTRRAVVLRHALPNALVPMLTVSGLQLSFLLGGTVITETLFSRPGMGRLLVDAILWQDLPVVQGVALVTAGFYVLTSLVVDIAAGWLDPRVGWQ
jgi:ABC-type dipeptide/oligopeptide/nickel transport system permease component